MSDEPEFRLSAAFLPSDYKSMANKVASLVQGDIDKLSVTKTTWGEQFRDAMNVNGGDLETAKVSHYIGHALAFFWKVMNAFRCFVFTCFSSRSDPLRIRSAVVDRGRLAEILRLALLHRHSHCRRRRRGGDLRLFSRTERQHHGHFLRRSRHVPTRHVRLDDRREKLQDRRRRHRQRHRFEQRQRLLGSRLAVARGGHLLGIESETNDIETKRRSPNVVAS